EVPVPARKKGTRSQEASEDHRGEGSEVPHQCGRPRLRHKKEPRAALPRRRRQGQSDYLLPWTRDDAHRPGSRDPGAVDQRYRRPGNRGISSPSGRQYAAPDPGAEEDRHQAARETGVEAEAAATAGAAGPASESSVEKKLLAVSL